MEDYKVLKDYPDYKIYEDGQVYSTLSNKFISMSDRGGYYYFSLVRVQDGVRKRVTRAQHQLVALVFIPNPENLPFASHLDGNGHNNKIENLVWSTEKQVSKRSHDLKIQPQIGRPVLQFTKKGKFVKRYDKVKDAAEAVSCCPATIGHACSGRRKGLALGYVWKFETEKEPLTKRKGEICKKVKGHEEYKVSNQGRVYSNITERYISPTARKDGYLRVKLNGKYWYLNVLVATVFHGPPPKHLKNPVVDHINGKKDDNRIENLEWIEFNENIRRACETGALSNRLPVIRYTLSGEEIKRYCSVAEAADDMGVSHTSILNACHKRKHCHTIKDCLWRFENDPLKEGETETITRAKTDVVRYSLDGKRLQEYSSVAEASKDTNTHRSSISHVCRKKTGTAGGWVWRYASDPPPKGIVQSQSRRVRQLSLQGEEIKVWDRITDAAKELGVQGSHITGVCKGNRKTTGGYRWEYIDSE